MVCLCGPAPVLAANDVAATGMILILGAVPQEITLLTEALADAHSGEVRGIPYWQGTLHRRPVVVAITGVGKTFAAMTTTLMLERFAPRIVVMTGTGARIDPGLRTGDVIVATTTNQHDFGSLGQTGMQFRPLKGPVGGNVVENRFVVAPELLEIAKQAIAAYPPQPIRIDGESYANRVRLGIVSTADLFGVPGTRIETLRREFHTDIMEMESAALALVCQSLNVPYLIVRAGSNLAQETPNDDYLKLGPIAAQEAARFTHHLLEYL